MEIYNLQKLEGGNGSSTSKNPTNDWIFNPQSNINKQQYGSWRIGAKLMSGRSYDKVRINVNTPKRAENWKIVEIT